MERRSQVRTWIRAESTCGWRDGLDPQALHPGTRSFQDAADTAGHMAGILEKMKPPKPKERNINAGIKTILELDDWHVFLMEPLWRDDWKKGTGELGQPDILALRYDPDKILWVEGKRTGGKAKSHQRIWHAAERARGALVWVAGEDFEASVEGFRTKYEGSGLCRRRLVAT